MEFNNRLLLKIIELAFTMTSIILIESVSDHSYSSQAMVVCGTLTGYMIICTTLALGHLVGAIIDKRIDILFAVAGCLLFISSGAVILDRWLDHYAVDSDKNSVLAAAAFCLANGAIFVADIFVIFNAIAIACIVMYEVDGALTRRPMIVCGTLGGYAIICGVLLIGHVINSLVEKRLNALIALIGCVLFVASGALVIDEWHDAVLLKERKRNAIAAGSLMIINGAVFLLDTLSICRT